MHQKGPIGVFDSGYGGLTVLKALKKHLPQHDFVYLGDNARTPYGTRSFETIYQFTLDAVKKLFELGCPLIVLACNTASSKALRSIQQQYLPTVEDYKRVLGVIRPTTEIVGRESTTGHIGVFGTHGTISSNSYPLEIKKNFPQSQVFQEACPMWVPLVENNEHKNDGADYFIKNNISRLFSKSSKIDTVILGCTHYPLLLPKINKYIPSGVKVLEQGEIVGKSLVGYLLRHNEMYSRCSRNSSIKFFTTDSTDMFDAHASIFFNEPVASKKISLP
ncbi:MAG: glutamate racemase [Bacteroidota bacterium]